MNENINLKEILKDCPKGTVFYSSLFGYVEFIKIDENSAEYPIVVQPTVDSDWENRKCFSKRGFYIDPAPSNDFEGDYAPHYFDAECTLFPSKGNKDWRTFKPTWNIHKHFDPFQKVLIASDYYDYSHHWGADIYNCYSESKEKHLTLRNSVVGVSDDEILPYEGNENLIGKPVEKSKAKWVNI